MHSLQSGSAGGEAVRQRDQVNHAVSDALKCKKFVNITGPLRKELEHWRFLATWEGNITLRDRGTDTFSFH